MHSTISQPRLKDGLLLGALVAAQVLSFYAGFFFARTGVVGCCCSWSATQRGVADARGLARCRRRGCRPHTALRDRLPERRRHRRHEKSRECRRYGATLWSYRATPPTNRLFGREGSAGELSSTCSPATSP
jgi:hypothetical protein